MTAVIALSGIPAHAQNIDPSTAVHLVVGQPPVRVTLPAATPNRFYDATVVMNRSYCAEATSSESELNPTDPDLVVFRADGVTPIGTDTGQNTEPKSQTAARVCFISPVNGPIYIRLSPVAGFENREYSLRFVETTLWANWFFVGSDYSSYTLLRNTTDQPLTVTLRWRDAAGIQVASLLDLTLAANGVIYRDARETGVMNCGYPTVCSTAAGSVEIVHNGSPEAIVGSQTTLAVSTGLSFDTLLFQRRPW
jgi:hypothetical protein